MYKARLVAKGFQQEYSVEFDEIFSPVGKMTTVCFLLGVVATENLELIQLDVKTAFLYGDLKEEIYMEQSKGSRTSSLPTQEEYIRPETSTATML